MGDVFHDELPIQVLQGAVSAMIDRLELFYYCKKKGDTGTFTN